MSLRLCGHLFYDNDCSGCREGEALKESQRDADRAHRERLRQLNRDAEKMTADELEELARSQRSSRSSPDIRCGHMTFHSDCSGCRHYEYSKEAAKEAERRAREFSKAARSRAEDARVEEAARTEPEASAVRPTAATGGDSCLPKLVLGVLVLGLALFVVAVVVSVLAYTALLLGAVAGVTRLVMLKTGRSDRWVPQATSRGAAVIRFAMIAFIPTAASIVLSAVGWPNMSSLLLLIALPLILWKVRKEFVTHRGTDQEDRTNS